MFTSVTSQAEGILYKFIEVQHDFFDFSEELLADIIKEGVNKEEILEELKKRKNKLIDSFRSIKSATLENEPIMTKEELTKS